MATYSEVVSVSTAVGQTKFVDNLGFSSDLFIIDIIHLFVIDVVHRRYQIFGFYLQESQCAVHP